MKVCAKCGNKIAKRTRENGLPAFWCLVCKAFMLYKIKGS